MIFGSDVATGQFASLVTAAPNCQSSEGYNVGYNPFQIDSKVGIKSRFNGCRIESSGGETSLKRKNPPKRTVVLLEIISCIKKSNVSLNNAIMDVPESISMPRKQAADVF